MYNDQMESKAIEGADLSELPVNALKGYYGHTMGAAGILETILTMHSLDHSMILGTKGYTEMGVSGRINIVQDTQRSMKTDFLKIISGFGGCNAALYCTKKKLLASPAPTFTTTHLINITTDSIVVDDNRLQTEGYGKAMLTDAYKRYIGDYPKYYKMDILARLGFIASELLVKRDPGNEH